MKFVLRWKWTIVGCMALVTLAAFRMIPTEAGPMPLVRMNAGAGWFSAEMAATYDHMKTGLMFRQSLDEHSGMLFAFTKADKHCMWMRNTLIPLSVAWLNEDGVVLEIQDMAPKSDELHCSSVPATYGLEVNQGAFARQGIVVGMRFL